MRMVEFRCAEKHVEAMDIRWCDVLRRDFNLPSRPQERHVAISFPNFLDDLYKKKSIHHEVCRGNHCSARHWSLCLCS